MRSNGNIIAGSIMSKAIEVEDLVFRYHLTEALHHKIRVNLNLLGFGPQQIFKEVE